MGGEHRMKHVISGREATAVDGRPSYSSVVVAKGVAYLSEEHTSDPVT